MNSPKIFQKPCVSLRVSLCTPSLALLWVYLFVALSVCLDLSTFERWPFSIICIIFYSNTLFWKNEKHRHQVTFTVDDILAVNMLSLQLGVKAWHVGCEAAYCGCKTHWKWFITSSECIVISLKFMVASVTSIFYWLLNSAFWHRQSSQLSFKVVESMSIW